MKAAVVSYKNNQHAHSLA